MKTKAIKKGFLSLLLAAVMLCTLLPLSAMAKSVDENGKITAISFTLTGYKYGNAVPDCTANCDDTWTAYNEGQAVMEFVEADGEYNPTADGYLKPGKQYYYGISFSEHQDSPGYSDTFNPENVTLNFNGKTCEQVKHYTGNNDGIVYYDVIYKLPLLEVIPMGIDFSTIIEQGGNVVPEKATFEFEVLNSVNHSNTPIANYTVGGKSITTEGKGDFKNTLTIANNDFQSVLNLLDEGIVVRQKKDTAEGWTYDESVWCVQRHHIPTVNALDDQVETVEGYTFDFYKGKIVDGEFEADSETPATTMTFTNTYTANKVEAPAEPTLPKAGDNNNIALWIALLSVSGAVMVGTAVFSRKRRNTK